MTEQTKKWNVDPWSPGDLRNDKQPRHVKRLVDGLVVIDEAPKAPPIGGEVDLTKKDR